jgi:hypothetical protein
VSAIHDDPGAHLATIRTLKQHIADLVALVEDIWQDSTATSDDRLQERYDHLIGGHA